MRDFKYIIKRVIIGTLIALAVMFVKQNVYAYEWETSVDSPIDISNYNFGYASLTSSLFRSKTPSYPETTNNLQTNFTSTGSINSLSYSSNVIPFYYNTIYLNTGGYTFESDTYYKLVIPIAYNSTVFTDLSTNFNTDKILDPTTYSFNNPNWSVYSASFAYGVSNDIEENQTFPEYMYFSIIFSGSQSVNDLTLYINGSNTISHTVTAFNTISDSNYLFKTNFTCSTFSTSATCGYYTQRGYKPFLYTTGVGENGCQGDGCYLDGNDIINNSSSDIKTAIDSIINGQFTEDLEFPYMNGGGRPFGSNEHSLQELLALPFEWLRTFVTDDNVCSGITLPLPGLSGQFTLPCLSAFMSSIFGSTFVIYLKMIIGVILGFKIIYALYRSVIHILSPDHLIWVDDIF